MLMRPRDFHSLIIRPGLQWLGHPFDSASAACLLLAIAIRESDLRKRVQLGQGGRLLPHRARGFWQFERTGVLAALQAPPNGWLRNRLSEIGYATQSVDVLHEAAAHSEIVMLLLARALLWSDRMPLPPPSPEGQESAYRAYDFNWRPGVKRPERWPLAWQMACETIAEAGHE